MKHPATRMLFAYWNALRAGRAAPERDEIDPSVIRDILPDTFMLDAAPMQQFAFRLAGTRVNALYDAELKGRSFLDLWWTLEQRNIRSILTNVMDGAAPIVAGAEALMPETGETPIELLFLPLRHGGRTHSRLLGFMKPNVTPSWLGFLPLAPLRLRSLRVIDGKDVNERWTLPLSTSPPQPRRPIDRVLGRAAPQPGPARPHTMRVITGGLG